MQQQISVVFHEYSATLQGISELAVKDRILTVFAFLSNLAVIHPSAHIIKHHLLGPLLPAATSLLLVDLGIVLSICEQKEPNMK